MKLKHLLAIFTVIACASFTSAQKKKDITSAEEMVVYNKKHNNDSYKDIIVVYNYEIKNLSVAQANSMKNLINTKFISPIKTEIVEENSKKYIRVTTEGNSENNPIYYELLRAHGGNLSQAPREYLLK